MRNADEVAKDKNEKNMALIKNTKLGKKAKLKFRDAYMIGELHQHIIPGTRTTRSNSSIQIQNLADLINDSESTNYEDDDSTEEHSDAPSSEQQRTEVDKSKEKQANDGMILNVHMSVFGKYLLAYASKVNDKTLIGLCNEEISEEVIVKIYSQMSLLGLLGNFELSIKDNNYDLIGWHTYYFVGTIIESAKKMQEWVIPNLILYQQYILFKNKRYNDCIEKLLISVANHFKSNNIEPRQFCLGYISNTDNSQIINEMRFFISRLYLHLYYAGIANSKDFDVKHHDVTRFISNPMADERLLLFIKHDAGIMNSMSFTSSHEDFFGKIEANTNLRENCYPVILSDQNANDIPKFLKDVFHNTAYKEQNYYFYLKYFIFKLSGTNINFEEFSISWANVENNLDKDTKNVLHEIKDFFERDVKSSIDYCASIIPPLNMVSHNFKNKLAKANSISHRSLPSVGKKQDIEEHSLYDELLRKLNKIKKDLAHTAYYVLPPSFGIDFNKTGDPFPASGDYFDAKLPLFVGRKYQLLEIYKRLNEIKIQIIVGSAGVGKTAITLAYIHSFVSDKDLYPGGVFWWDVNLKGANKETKFKLFLEHFGIGGDLKANYKTVLLTKLKCQNKTLFIFDDAESQEAIEAYLEVLIETHHHVIVTTWKSDWPLFRSKTLELDGFDVNLNEAELFINRHLNVNKDEVESFKKIAKKYADSPLLLRQIILYIKVFYFGSIKKYKEAQEERKRNLEAKKKWLDHRAPDIHRLTLIESIENIMLNFKNSNPLINKILFAFAILEYAPVPDQLLKLIIINLNKNEDINQLLAILRSYSLVEVTANNFYKMPYGFRKVILEVITRKMDFGVGPIKALIDVIVNSIYSCIDFTIGDEINYRIYLPYVTHTTCIADYISKHKIPSAPNKVVAGALYKCAYICYVESTFVEAEKIIKMAINLIADNSSSKYKATFSVIQIQYNRLLANIIEKKGDKEGATNIYKTEISRKYPDKHEYIIEKIITMITYAQFILGISVEKREEAGVIIEDAKSLRKKLNSEEHFIDAIFYKCEGDLYYATGNDKLAYERYIESNNAYSRFLNARGKKISTIDHPYIMLNMLHISEILIFRGRYRLASQKLNDVYKGFTNLYRTESHIDIIKILTLLGKCCFNIGEYTDAETHFNKVIDLCNYKPDNLKEIFYNTQHLGDSVHYLGRLLLCHSEYHAALNQFIKALHLQKFLCEYGDDSQEKPRKRSLEESPDERLIMLLDKLGYPNYSRIRNKDMAKIIHYIGLAHCKLRNYRFAKVCYREAILINMSIHETHPKAHLSDYGIANIYFRNGHYTKALKEISRIIVFQENAYSSTELSTIHTELANSFRSKARIEMKLEVLSEAAHSINSAIRIWNQYTEITTNFDKALVFLTKADFDLQDGNIESAEKNLILATESLPKECSRGDINTHPASIKIILAKGKLLTLKGLYIEAWECFCNAERAFELRKVNQENRGQAYYATPDVAMLLYDEACILINLSQGAFVYSTAFLTIAKEKLRQALKSISKALHPEKAYIYWRLAQIALIEKDYSLCSEYIENIKEQFGGEMPKNCSLNIEIEEICTQILYANDKRLEAIERSRNIKSLIDPKRSNYYAKQIDIYSNIIMFKLSLPQPESSTDELFLLIIAYVNYAKEIFKQRDIDIINMRETVRDSIIKFIQLITDDFDKITNLNFLIVLKKVINIVQVIASSLEMKESKKQCATIKVKISSRLKVISDNFAKLVATNNANLNYFNSQLCLVQYKVLEIMQGNYVCIFCGSAEDAPDEHKEKTKKAIDLLVSKGYGIIFGGGNVGLMNIVANQVIANGGKLIGVITEEVERLKVVHDKITYVFKEASYSQRKQRMFQLAKALVTLPGGLGTIDEMSEILIANQFASYESLPDDPIKPVCLFNISGYYTAFDEQLKLAVKNNYIRASHLNTIYVCDNAEQLVEHICDFAPPCGDDTRWWEKGNSLIKGDTPNDANNDKNDKQLVILPETLNDTITVGNKISETDKLPTVKNLSTYQPLSFLSRTVPDTKPLHDQGSTFDKNLSRQHSSSPNIKDKNFRVFDKQLSADDISVVCDSLIKKYQLSDQVQFTPNVALHAAADRVGSLIAILEKRQTELTDGSHTPIFAFTINLSSEPETTNGIGNHWVYAIVIFIGSGNSKCLIINSMSSKYDESLKIAKRQICQAYQILECNIEVVNTDLQWDDYNCGIWALAYFEQTLEIINIVKEQFKNLSLHDIKKQVLINYKGNIKDFIDERRNHFEQIYQAHINAQEEANRANVP